MAILLQDSSSGIWSLGVTTGGLLTTTSVSGLPRTLFINVAGLQSWQIGVTTGGLLTSTLVTFAPNRVQFIVLKDSSEQNWTLSVLQGGLLQTEFGGNLPWVPNGTGAGTDNSEVGGDGGYMAYPQPLQSGVTSINPEQNGQCAPLTFTFDTNDIEFVISNPGRNG